MNYCSEGHPAHDPLMGCGPCRDEELAGYGPRPYGMPSKDGLTLDTILSDMLARNDRYRLTAEGEAAIS